MPLRYSIVIATILGLTLMNGTHAAPDSPDPAIEKAANKKQAKPGHLFKNADGDGDGKISLAEIHAKAPEFPETRFTALDKDNDGFIAGDEIPVHAPKSSTKNPGENPKADRDKYLAKLMKKHDTDSDGKLTLAEIQTGKPGFPEASFTKLDVDKNGLLDNADLVAAEKPDTTAEKADKPTEKKDPAKKVMSEEEVAKRKELARKADTDKDGKLSFEEASAANPKLTRERFDQRDKNGDGFLDKADRKQS